MDRRICRTCTHPVQLHIKPIGPCRLNGCPCQEFVDGDAPAGDESGTRRVCFDIPEGFAMTVTFLPLEEEGS